MISIWIETDKMAVYNADGTVDMEEAACGSRLCGNTIQEYPKKTFAIKLASKAEVLGMPNTQTLGAFGKLDGPYHAS